MGLLPLRIERSIGCYDSSSVEHIEVEHPTADDVAALLARHHAFAHAQSPSEAVHALDVTGLLDSRITLYGLRRDGVLLGLGALKQTSSRELEIKSMHVAEDARGQGVGKQILGHLLTEARRRGATLIYLETGSTDAFAPARSMYEAAGFTYCERFGDYPDHPFSSFMRLSLTE
jgi:putative acetyltransferase